MCTGFVYNLHIYTYSDKSGEVFKSISVISEISTHISSSKVRMSKEEDLCFICSNISAKICDKCDRTQFCNNHQEATFTNKIRKQKYLEFKKHCLTTRIILSIESKFVSE